eukprot:Stramenopile-MAST_4_protein_4830
MVLGKNRLHPTSWNKGNHAKGGGRISKPVKPKISITNSARPWKYIPDNDLDVLFAPRVPKKKDTLDVRAPAGFGGSQFNIQSAHSLGGQGRQF